MKKSQQKAKLLILTSIFLIVFVLGLTGISQAHKVKNPAEIRVLYQAQQEMKKNHLEESLKILKKYLKKRSADPSARFYLILGNCYYQQEDYSKAGQAYKKGLRKEGANPSLALNLAMALYYQGNYNRAGKFFEKAFDLKKKKDLQLLYQAAVAYYQAENFKDTERTLSKLKKVSQDFKPEWMQLLVHVCIEQKKWNKAEEYLRTYLRHRPEQDQYWKLLAQVYLSKQDYQQAANALQISYQLNPPEDQGWKELSDLYAYLNAPLRAAHAWEKIGFEDFDSKGYLHLSRLYAQAYRYNKALKYIDKAIAKTSRDSLIIEKGQLCYRAGKYRQALKVFQKAKQLGKNKGETFLWLGYTHWQLEEWPQAREAFVRAGKFSSMEKKAKNGLDAIEYILEAKNEAGSNPNPSS